jgi:hypothetical protein
MQAESVMIKRGLWVVLALNCWLGGVGLARASGEEKVFDFEVEGFFLANYSFRTGGQGGGGKEGGDLILGEERFRLDIFGWAERIEASGLVKADLLHDSVTGDFDVDLREAYLDYTAGDFDFRLGRQIITWGVGDLLFINDVFPKDWVSFFAGRPLEYLKLGVDALRVGYSSVPINAELVLTPFFREDNLPSSNRFSFSDPFAHAAVRIEEETASTAENTEVALRLYRRAGGFDLSAYAYRGFWRAPGMEVDDPASPSVVTTFFPELSVYGASAQGGAAGGVVSLEAGYYHSRQDESGEDARIPNSRVIFLGGYQRQIGEDFQLGLQYYGEVMEDYQSYRDSLPAGFSAQKEYRDIVTLKLEKFFLYQTLLISLFAFYSPGESDCLVRPRITYRFTDRFSSTLGANVFGGSGATVFGRLDDDDNVYIWARFDF